MNPIKKLRFGAITLLLISIYFLPMRVATAQLKATLKGHTDNVYCVAFSPDGSILASASFDGTVRLWEVPSGRLFHVLTGHTNSVHSVSFSPDGQTLASGGWESTIRLWDPSSGKLNRTLTSPSGVVGSAIFSPDGRILAVGGGDGIVYLWNTTTWQVEDTLTGHTHVIDSMAFSDNGSMLASASRDETARVWNMRTRQHIRTFTEHSHEVFRVAFSPDGSMLASSSRDGVISLWNLDTGQLEGTASGRSMVFSPDGIALVIGGEGISFWEIDTQEHLGSIGDVGRLMTIAYSPDGRLIAGGGLDNLAYLWGSTPPELPFSDVPFDVNNIPEPVPPPPSVVDYFNLTPFYQQWISVDGFPVIASTEVNSYAMKEAAWVIWRMIGHRPNILRALARGGQRVSVLSINESLGDLPEYDRSSPTSFIWEGARDIVCCGNTTTAAEEVLFCQESDYCYSFLIHEFAHTIHHRGLNVIDPTFDNRLQIAYDAAIKKGLWKDAYAASNRSEYWAEGVGSWFNAADFRNPVKTRDALKRYDPSLALLIAEVFGDGNWRYTPFAARMYLPHLQGFNRQEAFRLDGTPLWSIRQQELEAQLRDPNSDGGGRWVNLQLHDPSQLPSLLELATRGNHTAFILMNLTGHEISLYSVDADGREHFRYRSTTRILFDFNTYAGAVWLVKGRNGEDLAVFRVEKRTGRLLLLPADGGGVVLGNVAREFNDTAYLNTDVPPMVRLIYFVPNDRLYHADVEQRAKDHVRKSQIFFAEQMRAHGYGNKTFRVETDSEGEPMVHRVAGQYPNSHYFSYMQDKVLDEVRHTFDLNSNLYYIVLGTDGGFRRNDGQAGGGTGQRWGKVGGFVMASDKLDFGLTAHELGHAFGLYHDFRDGSYIMSSGLGRKQLSACHAEYLVMSPYFNADVPIEHRRPPTIELISSRTYPAGSKSVPIRLKISDSEGLHQALLFVRTSKSQGIDRAPQLKLCRGLEGKTETIVEFDYDGVIPSDSPTSFSNPTTHPISVEAVDMNGNVTRTDFVLFSETLQPLTKLSGDNQTGLPNTPLPVPFVVQVQNVNDGSAPRRVAVTFTVTAGGGMLTATSTITDENNRAQSTLTLGPNLGTTTVEVSAAGIEGTVTFTAVAGAAVDIPDPNLRAAIEINLGKAEGDPIASAEMETLTHLQARNANISDLTGLEFATNLTSLDLGYGEGGTSHAVKDLSPLADLTQLTRLHLPGKSISDISAVTGLTNLTWLNLWGNPISDISPVAGLTNLTDLYLGGGNNISDISPLVANTGLGKGDTVNVQSNPLSYLSIHTHIPALQSRGVTVEFDKQAHPALLKISGDNQKGVSSALLSQPFVVEAQDANGSALAGISVTFAVVTGGGTLNTTITRTDTNGRAQSTLTLGPNLGTNTVEVSAARIEVPATFHAISDTEAPSIAADVNSDGSVNVLDLVVIASELGNTRTNLAVDVNRDGAVNVLDLILVAGMFDGAAAAPPAQPQVPETLTAVEVQGWLTDARALEARNPIMKRGLAVLEQLLISLTPRETVLLANYPNPFNPETWIPYRLAEDAFVTLTIYDGSGRVVRTLDVGHRIAAVYESRSKAVHWDGRNNLGEQVASGVYFYTLTAGDFSATRKMLILK